MADQQTKVYPSWPADQTTVRTPCSWEFCEGVFYLYDREGQLIMVGPEEDARKHWVVNDG
jgi:hypothetical protein